MSTALNTKSKMAPKKRAKRHKVTDGTWQLISEMSKQGATLKTIADTLGVSVTTAMRGAQRNKNVETVKREDSVINRVETFLDDEIKRCITSSKFIDMETYNTLKSLLRICQQHASSS